MDEEMKDMDGNKNKLVELHRNVCVCVCVCTRIFFLRVENRRTGREETFEEMMAKNFPVFKGQIFRYSKEKFKKIKNENTVLKATSEKNKLPIKE